jgi:serine/threonine protein phosphatase 1
MKFFVLSDVHSFYDAMMEALHKNGFDMGNPDHHVIICGDLFDRGPDACKVLEFAKTLASAGRLQYVAGNHEDLLFDCIAEIGKGTGISGHHFDNGTVDTICQITGVNKYALTFQYSMTEEFITKLTELTDFIADNAVDFVEIDRYVFVHGWIPFTWRYGQPNTSNWENGNWSEARWTNGMQAWWNGASLPDKTIVCGHYHSSWGHSHLNRDRKEFPPKNRKDWQKSFEPFIDKGIIALDACTAYSDFCNCLVVEI